MKTMKIAVSASGSELDSPTDERFGRAKCFIVVEPSTMKFEVLENKQNLEAAQGAGIQTARLVSESGAQVVLTGHCGPKAFQTLRAAGIQVILGVTGTVREVLKKFEAGEYEPADLPDVQGHWS